MKLITWVQGLPSVSLQHCKTKTLPAPQPTEVHSLEVQNPLSHQEAQCHLTLPKHLRFFLLISPGFWVPPNPCANNIRP